MNGMRIYLAEDDQDDINFFGEALGEVSDASTLEVFGDGHDLLEHLKNGETLPEIIFLDINMPVMNGLECLKRIRENSRFDHIPVIMLTTTSARATIELAYNDGANLFVKKPYNYRDPRAMIQFVVSGQFAEHRANTGLSNFLYNVQ